MKLMTCSSCKGVVIVNNTGVCIACQLHSSEPQADAYTPEMDQTLEPTYLEILKKKEQELEEKLTQLATQPHEKQNDKKKKTTRIRYKDVGKPNSKQLTKSSK